MTRRYPTEPTEVLDEAIRSTLRSGERIALAEMNEFSETLYALERRLCLHVKHDPIGAHCLYEKFVPACYAKVLEGDDRDVVLTFWMTLIGNWVRARQAARLDPHETARLLFAQLESSPLGFRYNIERSIAGQLNRAGLRACTREARARLEAPGGAPRWTKMLRAIYERMRNVERYLALVAPNGPTPEACVDVARMRLRQHRWADAFAWIERGRRLCTNDTATPTQGEILSLGRELLVKLDRGREAAEYRWSVVYQFPSYRDAPRAHSASSASAPRWGPQRGSA